MRIVSFLLARIDRLRLSADDNGATLIEYGIVLGMVTVGAILALSSMGHYSAKTLSMAASSISP